MMEDFSNDDLAGLEMTKKYWNSIEAQSRAEALARSSKGYIEKYGEEYRKLITDALSFLYYHEPSWKLDTPIDIQVFMENLIKEASK